MPLSEQEQRLLDEMERSLYHNDAEFVASTTSRRGKPTYSVVVAGILVGIVGVGILISGVVIRQPLVGVLGFVFMFAGVMLSVTPSKRSRHVDAEPTEGAHRSSFMQNLNERWDKRQQEHDE